MARSAHPRSFQIVDRNRTTICVTDDDLAEIYGGQLVDTTLNIHNNNETTVYILGIAQFGSITACTNCIIFIGGIEKLLHIDRCENSVFVVACHNVRISDCRHCTFYMCANRPPIIMGSRSAGLKLAPYNSYYGKLEDHLSQININTSTNYWSSPICLMGASSSSSMPSSSISLLNENAVAMASNTASVYSLLPPAEFAPFIVPFKIAGSTKRNPCPLPPEYSQALREKSRRVRELRYALATANLDTFQKRDLTAVVHEQFMTWLIESGNMRQIQDLLQMAAMP